MRIAFALPALAAMGLAALGAATPKTKVVVTSTSKTDTPAKKGEASSQAAAWARTLEIFFAEAMTDKFPCSSSMTPSDLSDLLGHERDLELLGAGGDPATLASLANSLDARYLIGVTVTQSGGRSAVSVVVIDAKSAKVLSRNSRVIPVDSGAADALQDFANQSVASLGGLFIKCATPGWKGSITVTTTMDKKGKNANGKDTFTENGSATLACTLTGAGSNAICSYSSNYVMAGNGVTLQITKTAEKADVYADASLVGGKLTLEIGVVPVLVTVKNSIASDDSGPAHEGIASESFEVQATPDPKSQSGSWSDPNPMLKQLGSSIKVDWSLTKD